MRIPNVLVIMAMGVAFLAGFARAEESEPINPFPPGGTDFLELRTPVKLEIYGKGVDELELEGWFVVTRSDPDEKGERIIPQILAMDVRGTSKLLGPISVHVSPTAGSYGDKNKIAEQINADEHRFSFEGWFDVMFEIRVHAKNLLLFNKEPLRISAKPKNIPPIGAVGVSVGDGVELYSLSDPDSDPVGKLLSTRKVVGSYVDLDYLARKIARAAGVRARRTSVPGSAAVDIPTKPE